MGCFRLVENPPANMFLDSFSRQWCQRRLFSMLVTAPPQPKHNNTVCSRLLSLTFLLMHYLQGCKWDVWVYQCSAACMEMHFPNGFQRPFLQMPYSSSTYVFSATLSYSWIHRDLLIAQKALHIYKSTDWKSWNRLWWVLGFAAQYLAFWPLIYRDDPEWLWTILFFSFYNYVKKGGKRQVRWIFGTCMPLFLLFKKSL